MASPSLHSFHHLRIASRNVTNDWPERQQARQILIGTALLLALGLGTRQSFGLFLMPVTYDLAVTAADFTLALAVQNIVWSLSQALVGAIADLSVCASR
jgi:sugar phosphate permease